MWWYCHYTILGILNFGHSLFPEFTVQIHPAVVSAGYFVPSTTCSSTLTGALRKLFLDASSKSALIKKIGCFDFTVLDDRLSCSHVTVVLKFLNESAVKTFEEYCYSQQLAKNLEQYCLSVGLHMDIGYSYQFTGREFRFKITIERQQCIIQKKTVNQDSLRWVFGENKWIFVIYLKKIFCYIWFLMLMVLV